MRRLAMSVVMIAACGGSVTQAQMRDELVERTLAIVGGRAVTLTDTVTAMALGLVPDAGDRDAAIETLVNRALVLREVERYAPPEPRADAIDDRLAEIRARSSESEIAAALAAGGFTEARLRAWVRDDLRIAAYLEQRFAATADVAVEQASPEVRARLSAERRASLIADWITDLRRRSPIVELWKR